MVIFLSIFLVIIAIYQIIITLSFGAIDWWLQTQISLLRDGIWIAFLLSTAFVHFKKIRPYFIQRKWSYLVFGILILFSLLLSYFKWAGYMDMMIGIKYWFYFIFIFLSATRLGFIMSKKQIKQFSQIMLTILVWILIFWFIWQIAKFFFPEFFYTIGYWKFDDFYFWINPPIYYLTEFEWTTRRQWLFAWPNNYWYFLVAFLPLLLISPLPSKTEWGSVSAPLTKGGQGGSCNQNKPPQPLLVGGANSLSGGAKTNRFIIFLRILAIVLTLSRSALLGTFLILILIFWKKLIQNKKLFFSAITAWILSIVAISILKRESTIWHITQKLAWLEYVINQPSGYWLGSSGPWVHHSGEILPENYYIQIMIDIWVLGFLILLGFATTLFTKFKKIFAIYSDKKLENTNFEIWKALLIGVIALLFIGLFLHVFEDSMVNYILFICFGIFTWYLLKHEKVS